MSKIPEGWGISKLGKISEVITSGSRDWAQYYSISGSKFIRMTNLRRDGIHLKLNDMKYVDVKSDSSDGKRTSLQYGDILISITAELGKIGWVPSTLGEAYINQHTALVRLNMKAVSTVFIAYLLTSKHMHYVINSLNDAGAKAGLNLSTIRGLTVVLPPLPEQKKIAKILSIWDRAIEATEKLLNNSQQQKKSLMQQLLTGKKRLPRFSGEWQSTPVKKMGKIVSGGTPDTKVDEYWEGDVLWMTPTDVTALKNRFINNTKRKITQSGVKNSSATLMPKGSLLVCTRATIGLMSISTTEITTNQGFKNIIPDESHDVSFLYYLFNYFKNKLIAYACGSTFLELSKKDFEKIHFLCPIVEEQQKIASVLSIADKEIETLQQKLIHLKQEKKALMQQLLTGKRRVVL